MGGKVKLSLNPLNSKAVELLESKFFLYQFMVPYFIY